MLSYLIVGSGYRSEYYGRVAARYPKLFKALYLCRSKEKARAVSERTGTQAVTDVAAALAYKPDFVVVAVDYEHVADVCLEWTGRGYPVLTETPVGSSMEKLLRLWDAKENKGALISCCEQYHRYPVLCRGLRAISDGLIGEPQSAYLSLAHDYHGISLIRRMLKVEREGYEMCVLRTENKSLATDSRYGAVTDGSAAADARTRALIRFDSGKSAIYDFSSFEYRSFIRARHLCVQGDRGEWSDRIVYYADQNAEPQRLYLMPEVPEKYRCLDTQALRDLRKTWQGELFLDTLQDEFAVATMLYDMDEFIRGGSAPYSLNEALDDAYFKLLLEKAASEPLKAIRSKEMPWNVRNQ